MFLKKDINPFRMLDYKKGCLKLKCRGEAPDLCFWKGLTPPDLWLALGTAESIQGDIPLANQHNPLKLGAKTKAEAVFLVIIFFGEGNGIINADGTKGRAPRQSHPTRGADAVIVLNLGPLIHGVT